MNKARYCIGIDPGTDTGFAVWDAQEKKFEVIETVFIHKAMENLLSYWIHADILEGVFVRIEDARLRKWFGQSGREKLQGAGSIKRDCVIWEDFLTDKKIPFIMLPPREGLTKMKSDPFKKFAKWDKPTNNHGRDAAMLVIGM